MRFHSRAFILALTVLLVTLAAAPARAQTAAPARNAFYLELLGHGGPYSVNYERVVQPRVRARLGMSLSSATAVTADGTGGSATVVLVPLTASYLWGRTHHLELGGGGVLGYGSARLDGFGEASGVLSGIAGLVGYRYQRPSGGILVRAAYTPLLSGDTFSNWIGLALGYAF